MQIAYKKGAWFMQKKNIYVIVISIVIAVIVIISIATLVKDAPDQSSESTIKALSGTNQPPVELLPPKAEIIDEYAAEIKKAYDANDSAKIDQLNAEMKKKLIEAEKQRIEQLRRRIPQKSRPESTVKSELEKSE